MSEHFTERVVVIHDRDHGDYSRVLGQVDELVPPFTVLSLSDLVDRANEQNDALDFDEIAKADRVIVQQALLGQRTDLVEVAIALTAGEEDTKTQFGQFDDNYEYNPIPSEVVSSIAEESKELDHLSEEAKAFADQIVAQMQADLNEELPMDGSVKSRVNAELRESDRERQAELEGSGFLYFGHTRKIWPYMYDAILNGYKPSERQLQMAEAEGGYNHLDDEITELHNEHPDIYQKLNIYSYGSNVMPITPHFVGAYAIPERVVKDIIGTLYMRGQAYRECGWGFPWMESDMEDDTIRIEGDK